MLNFSVLLSAVTCTFEGEQSCCFGRSGSLECVESGVCIYQVPCFSFMRTQTAIICDCDCKVMQKFWSSLYYLHQTGEFATCSCAHLR